MDAQIVGSLIVGSLIGAGAAVRQIHIIIRKKTSEKTTKKLDS